LKGLSLPIFVDTSAWYALLDKTDSDHASAVKFKESLTHSLVTTNYVADEIINSLRYSYEKRDPQEPKFISIEMKVYTVLY